MLSVVMCLFDIHLFGEVTGPLVILSLRVLYAFSIQVLNEMCFTIVFLVC